MYRLFRNKYLPRLSPRFTLALVVCMAFALSACTGSPAAAPVSAAVPVTGATPPAAPTQAMPAQSSVQAAPALKAYIGLFKDNAVAVLDTSTNQVLSKIPVPVGPHGLVITPDGRWVYVSSDGDSKVSVIDTLTDKVVDTIEVGKMPHGLAITPAGDLILAAVFGTNQVVIIDTHTHAVIGEVSVPSPHNIAISPDGETAYVASQKPGDASLAILAINKQTQTGKVPLTKIPRALNFSPDGKLLYFTQAGVDAVQVLDPKTNQITAQIPVGASPHHPLFTPDGKTALVVVQGPGQLSIIDPQASKVRKVVTVGKMPHWIALNPQGTTAWVTNEASNDVSVVDLSSGSVTATIAVGNAPRKLVVQPAAPAAAQISAGDQAGTQISISGMAFSPDTLTVKAGQTITITNHDSITHAFTADQGQWDSGNIDPGKSYSLTLKQPGRYSYHCSIHPFMMGTILVTP